MRLAQAGRIKAVFRQAADFEILDHDIGMGHQAVDDGEVFRLAEIRHDRALAAVAGMKICGRKVFARGTLDKGRPPLARIITGRTFDLDHIRAQISQKLANPGSGKDAGKFEDAQARQRFRHAGLIPSRDRGHASIR